MVEKSLFKKLQLLDDFSQTVPSNNMEEPTAAARPSEAHETRVLMAKHDLS